MLNRRQMVASEICTTMPDSTAARATSGAVPAAQRYSDGCLQLAGPASASTASSHQGKPGVVLPPGKVRVLGLGTAVLAPLAVHYAELIPLQVDL